MKSFEQLIDALEQHIPQQTVTNANVSEGSVGWHIEHCLLVINQITNAVQKSNAADYKWGFSMPRMIVFTTGKIPRGRAKAPKSVQPQADFDTNTLKEHIERTRQRITAFDTLDTNAWFSHPFFGKLNKKGTIKFLKIHTKHHLHIIKDILKG